MGTRGPKPGKTGKAARKKPVIYTGEFSQPPAKMTKEAKERWKQIVRDFPPNYHQQKHFSLLEIFCESFATWSKARTQLAGENLTIENKKTGIVKTNPLIAIINGEVAKMNQLATKLSLTVPLDRPDSDTSFQPTISQDEKERIAYKRLRERESTLQGAELSLFVKLKEIFECEKV